MAFPVVTFMNDLIGSLDPTRATEILLAFHLQLFVDDIEDRVLEKVGRRASGSTARPETR